SVQVGVTWGRRGENDCAVSLALRRRRLHGAGDARGRGQIPQATTSRDSMLFSGTTRTTDAGSAIASRTGSTSERSARAMIAGPVPLIPAARAPASRARIAGASLTPRTGAYGRLFASLAAQ